MKANTEGKFNELNKQIGNRKNIFGQVLVEKDRLFTETTSNLMRQDQASSHASIPSQLNSINSFMQNV